MYLYLWPLEAVQQKALVRKSMTGSHPVECIVKSVSVWHPLTKYWHSGWASMSVVLPSLASTTVHCLFEITAWSFTVRHSPSLGSLAVAAKTCQ